MNEHDFRSQLSLPETSLIIETRGGKDYVYDQLRKKWLKLTPEEWVRQHFVSFLQTHLGYPSHCFANEVVLPNSVRKGRTDSLVYGVGGKPWMLIEYKASRIALTEKDWKQLLSYNLYHRADYLCLTNGIKVIICKVNLNNGESVFLKQLPHYQELKEHYQS